MIEITPRKMTIALSLHFYFLLAIMTGNASIGQRIVTIQLDGTQYYVSKMNPYSSELNYFLAYQYCRSIGLQLVSFETQEKADAITEYLKNAGYSQHDFWTSGNHLGSNMLLWMSTGLPFNATFNYMRKQEGDDPIVPSGPLPMGRKKRGGMANTGCIALKANSLDWDTEDCSKLKEFICEQTRCYFYNYGSIPVSPAQGHNHKHKEQSTTTSTTYSTIINQSYASSLPTSYSTSSPAATTSTATITTTSAPPPSSTTFQQQQYPSKLSTYYLSPVTNSPAVTTVESHSETEQPSNNNTEEDTNEIDLATTEIPTTVDYASLYGSEEANKQDQQQYKETAPDEPPTAVNRTRTTRILETESNSARNMPDAHPEAFPWAWAKNILLEKPIMKKTAQE